MDGMIYCATNTINGTSEEKLSRKRQRSTPARAHERTGMPAASTEDTRAPVNTQLVP